MHPFINKLLCFMLAIALVVSLAVPVFAAVDEDSLISSLPTNNDYPNGAILYFEESDVYIATVWSAVGGVKFSDGHYYIERKDQTAKLNARHYQYMSNGWELTKSYADIGLGYVNYYSGQYPKNGCVVYTNIDIIDKDGNVYIPSMAEPDYCDGSSCSATDANHDNICDDCGKVLAYNLRSTLLDFAKAHAATFTDHPYFAVLEHPSEDNKYNVYLSAAPMFANPTDYETAYGTNLRWCQVFEDANGTFSYTGDLSVTKFSGTLVYANHDIKNFQEPPLAVIIQGVTGEALEVEIPSLMTEVRIILLCGVGCLALLIALVLLSKKLKIFLKR